jgi:prevent-host-death family protein
MFVNIHDAKTTLSRLIALAEAGEEVVLTRRNVPVARLLPVEEPEPARVFGDLAGVFEVSDTFFDPLPDALLDVWER